MGASKVLHHHQNGAVVPLRKATGGIRGVRLHFAGVGRIVWDYVHVVEDVFGVRFCLLGVILVIKAARFWTVWDKLHVVPHIIFRVRVVVLLSLIHI